MRLYQFALRLVQPINKVPLFISVLTLATGIIYSQFCHATETTSPVQNRVVSYQLTASDVQGLEKNADLIDQVRELQNQTYAAKSGLETAVNSIIAEAPPKYRTILSKLIEKPGKTTVYKFTDQSLVHLEANGLPEDITANVKNQAAATYADSQELNAAVNKMLPSPYKTHLALIIKSAEKRTYRLSDRFLEILKKADLPATAFKELEHLNGQGMPNKKEFIEAATGIISLNASKGQTHFPDDNATRRSQREEDVETPQTGAVTEKAHVKQTTPNVASEVTDALQKLKAKGSGYIEELKTYTLTKHSFAELKKNKVPTPIIHRLKKLKIKGVTYIDKQVFVEEVKPALANEHTTYMNYRSLIFASAEKQEAFKAGQESVNDVLGKLSIDQIPADIIQKIGPILNIEYPNEAVFKNALTISLNNQYQTLILALVEKPPPYKLTQQSYEALQQADIAPQTLELLETLKTIEFKSKTALANKVSEIVAVAVRPYVPLIVQQARKEHVLSEGRFEPNIVQGDACDCYRDDFSRLTYGFYPFWEIEKQPDEGQTQKVDFSVLARIGLYSFPVDENGRVQQNIKWLKQIGDFFKTSHKYRTQVDLVLYNAHWEQWGLLAKDQEYRAIDEFAANIVTLLASSDHKTLDWFKTRIGTRKTVAFEGLTIDLHGFGHKNWPYGIKLIKEIRKNLQKTGHKYHLNLIIPGQNIDDIVKVLSSIREIIPDNETQTGPVDYFIVFLNDPITITKKKLRSKIEEKFKGVERRNIVRKIIPVMNPNGHAKKDFEQLFDDLIYMEDNYGGVGFWPLPIVKDDSGQELNTLLRKVFELEYTGGSSWTDLTTMACKIICPNRWLVRIIWDLFFVLALVCLILYYSICRVREMMNKYFLFVLVAVVLPFVLIGLGLLFCDPYYSKIAKGNGPLLFVILGIIVYSIVSYRLKKKKADLP